MGDHDAPAKMPDLVLDNADGFVKWFRRLPEDAQVVRFFDRKDYYTVHGESALMIAREFYRTMTVVKKIGRSDDPLPGVSLNRSMFETVLRDLLLERAENTIELYEGSGANWKVTRTASPGNIKSFEEELFRTNEMAESPVVMAVNLSTADGQRVVGVAYANTTARRLGACQFSDDEQFCALEHVIVQLGAKECVIPKDLVGTPDGKRLHDVLSRCGALASERKRSDFATRDVAGDVGRLLRSGRAEQHGEVLERECAVAALAGLLSFTELLMDEGNFGKYTLELHESGKYMRLDAAAMRALNVMKSKTDANDNFSLYGLMNRARTPMGKRLLKVWLKQPLLDVSAIKERHDVVEAFAEDPSLCEGVRNRHLRGMPDVERLTRKLERRRATLADLCQLYRASGRIPLLVSCLREYKGVHSGVLEARFAKRLEEAHGETHLTKFEELLEAAVDLDRIPDEYLISPTYDDELRTLREERDEVEGDIQDAAEAAARDLGLVLDKAVKLERNNQFGHYLRITKKEETAVRKKINGGKYQVLDTKKDGVKFTCRELRKASERDQKLADSYGSRQKELVESVVGVASSYVEVWEGVSAVLSELDVLAGFAELSANAPTPYVRPDMREAGEGDLVLAGSRHPCVEAQESVEFIPNDCELKRGQSWFQIITGPNMGGKSTYIRQVGVCVLMAQVGCFVPCDKAEIPVRDCVFARVGAGDCQLKGVSTFMAEMLETASILKGATNKSLIIIDELGRGTSTYDGFGLAWAISEHICEQIGAPCLFATHFHELTSLTSQGGVVNRHVEAAIDAASQKLTMLYQVKPGACDQSFGIHVAEFARFPDEVVKMAREKAAELEDFSPPPLAGAGGAGGVGGKRKRVGAPSDDEARARARAREFLSEFSALPLDKLKPAEAVARARELRAALDVDAADNPALRTLLGAQ